MMHKGMAIIFAVIYLLGTSGIVLSRHYCCGQFQHVDLFTVQGGSCCDHGDHQCTSSDEKCCKYDVVYYSVDDEHAATSAISMAYMPLVQETEIPTLAEEIKYEVSLPFPDVPDPPGVPVYIKFHQLVLYA
ncbi:MAG: hypothetical protein KDC12_03385 [Flavobacteriales bacterium]|nr:hypothetical protein [Flavobacteriales bacterium]